DLNRCGAANNPPVSISGGAAEEYSPQCSERIKRNRGFAAQIHLKLRSSGRSDCCSPLRGFCSAFGLVILQLGCGLISVAASATGSLLQPILECIDHFVGRLDANRKANRAAGDAELGSRLGREAAVAG